MAKDDQKMTVTASKPRSIDKPRGSTKETMKLATYHANLILGSYRADQAADPEVYVAAITHLLSKYPPDIGARLSDPKDGVAGKLKFLPTVSEVKEEADRLIKAEQDAAYRQAELKRQWELRDQIARQANSEPLDQRRRATKRIMDEYKNSVATDVGKIYDVFVPTFAPQYADMVARGGKPGVSLEDKDRSGVWVPHSWLLQNSAQTKSAWQQFTADDILKMYPQKNQDESDASIV